ncbi:MAG TPA: isoprenylcysteine carboxylmethyltransferase family protein [Anaerolineales bacterium]|nr:isoprenylcysteine carboxylmethyltransferase family protein [Anaerolineales bacterium]
MNTQPEKQTSLSRFLIRFLASIVLIVGVLGGLLFTSAGRLDWPAAWVLISLYTIFLLFVMSWGYLRAPELMQERGRVASNVKSWDKLINALYLLALILLFIVAGLDERYDWSQFPAGLQWLGGLGFSAAGYVIWRTMAENAYLSRWARIQDDRGQTVISSGPYRIVRHPMYAAIITLVICMTLELGSFRALVPAAFAAVIYVIRTRLEDRMLHEELAGYREYASKVRYRLAPGIW